MARKPNPVDLRLLSKVSKLYYEQKLTQQEIAERLRLSRPKVSRLLQQAHDEGLVQITVLSPPGGYADLEQKLEQTFHLKEVVVVEVDEGISQDGIVRELGVAAADYLLRTVEDGDVIGVSWGTTLNAMVNAIQPFEVEDCHVVQLIGGLGAPEAEVHATALCRRIARLLSARLTLIPAPGIVDDLKAKQILLSDSHIQNAFALFPHVTVAYVGIGVPTPDSVVMRDGTILSQSELEQLLARNAVGDIALRFFDVWGRPVRSDLDNLVVGITLDQLKSIGRVVGVAGGMKKLNAILGALRGHWINVLITDNVVARALCEEPLRSS